MVDDPRDEQQGRAFLEICREVFDQFGLQVTEDGPRRTQISEPEGRERQLGVEVFPGDETVPEFAYYLSLDYPDHLCEEVFGRGPDGVLRRQPRHPFPPYNVVPFALVRRDEILRRVSECYVDRANLPSIPPPEVREL